MTTPTITDNASAHRYEAMVDGELAAIAEYNALANGLLFTHTEAMPKFEGKGIASQIAKFALDDVRARKLQAIPVCQFIAAYIRKHPSYLDLVSEDSKRAYQL